MYYEMVAFAGVSTLGDSEPVRSSTCKINFKIKLWRLKRLLEKLHLRGRGKHILRNRSLHRIARITHTWT